MRTSVFVLFLLAASWRCVSTLAISVRSNVLLNVAEGATDHVVNGLGTDSTGCKIWDAGRILSSKVSAMDLSGKRVLELGSGTGVGGLTAAACGASVCLTDRSPAMLSLIESNAAANGLEERVRVCPLSWGCPYDTAEILEHGPFDLIIGSDLLCT